MDMSQIGILEILAATFTGMILGAFWYSPIAFGNAWMKAIGKTPETLGSATMPMIGSVFASLFSAIGVAVLHSALNISALEQALILGLLLGLLIIFPALLSDNLFCGWGTPLLLIQAGYRVVAILLMSLVVYLI